MPALRLGGYWASGLLFTNIKGAHWSPDLVLPPDQCLGGYCIACSMQKILSAIQFSRILWSLGWSAAPNLSLEDWACRFLYPEVFCRARTWSSGRFCKSTWVSAAAGISGLTSSFRCISGFRPIHTLRATGYISRQRINYINKKHWPKISPWPRCLTTSEAVRHKARALVAGSIEGISGIKLG